VFTQPEGKRTLGRPKYRREEKMILYFLKKGLKDEYRTKTGLK